MGRNRSCDKILLGPEPRELRLIVDTHRSTQCDDEIDSPQIRELGRLKEPRVGDPRRTVRKPIVNTAKAFERDMLQNMDIHLGPRILKSALELNHDPVKIDSSLFLRPNESIRHITRIRCTPDALPANITTNR